MEMKPGLIPATEQHGQDDFSWDDEPEEITSTSARSESKSSDKEAVSASQDVPHHPHQNQLNASTSTSPRDSEESYDVVSDQGLRGKKETRAASTEDDEDSDWE